MRLQLRSAISAITRRRCTALVTAALVTAALASLALAPSASAASTGVLAWGYNETGALGNGGTKGSTTAVPTTGLRSGVRAVAAGDFFSLALLRDGTAVAWGMNASGELGNGTHSGPEKCIFESACSTKPVPVSGLGEAVTIAGGGVFGLALLRDGTVVGWGGNAVGELGDGGTEESDVPVPVKGLTGVTAIAAGDSHGLALLSDGTVMAWGWNIDGQLGDGTRTNSDVPVAVSGLSGVTAIAAGGNDSLALLGNGTVMAWGANESGQLGNGTNAGPENCSQTASPEACSTTPVAVGSLSGVSAISAGSAHSLALLSGGTVMSWGSNNDGQLGNGRTTDSSVPVSVVGLSGVSAISAGGNHNLARLGNRTLMAWGDNGAGQLGNGSTMNSSLAVPVSEVSGADSIATGLDHSLVYAPPPPIVTAVAPAEGPRAGGSAVTISGHEFTGASAVKFGSAPAQSFMVNSDESISAVSPPGSGTVDVTVTSIGGESAAGAADRYTYVHVASEGLPELGRCVKVSSHKGAYARSNCLLESAGHAGAFEWVPGPGSKAAFKGAIAHLTLQGAGATVLSCTAGDFSGSYTGAVTDTLNLSLSGCKNGAGKSCESSPTKAGEVSTAQALEGELGFIKSGLRPKVGFDFKAKSPAPAVLSFECREGAEAPTQVLVEGSVIAQALPIDSMKTTRRLIFKAKGAAQVPERFEGRLPDVLSASFTSVSGKSGPERVGLALLGAGTTYVLAVGEEPLEIKAKV